HVERVLEPARIPAEGCGLPSDLIAHGCEPAWGDPDPQPAIAEPRGAGDRGLRSSADDQRYPWRRRGENQRVIEREELALERDRGAVGEAAQDSKTFVHPASTRLGVHTADLDLVRVLAADSDAEREPAGCKLCDRRELPRDRDRMAQRQEVEPDVHWQLSVG